jgi:hypothetical protein
MARRLLGAPVPMRQPPPLVRWVYRRMDRVIETGRFPWERPNPALRRPGGLHSISVGERR